MSFSDKFNEYLSLLNVSYPQFARYSGMSASAVRRYKNGESEPVAESAQIKKLANGIYRMSVEKILLSTRMKYWASLKARSGTP